MPATKDETKEQFRVMADIDFPTDAAVIVRIQAGENVPIDERGTIKHIAAGKLVTLDQIPEISRGWLVEQEILLSKEEDDRRKQEAKEA
jgi:hypothetical protein